MLAFISILIMLAVGYAYLVEGLFTALIMCVNVILGGLVAFNFFEPLADQLQGLFGQSFMAGYEDALCLVVLFSITVGALRVVVNNIEPSQIEYPEWLQRGGGALFGMATGYLAAGFLVCVMETIPFHANFVGFEPKFEAEATFLRRVLPPDRVWLAMLHRAGTSGFGTGEGRTFDEGGSFALRYWRHRRYADDRGPLPYGGEFDAELKRGQ